ncbi:hypothetical protein Golomagni_02715 [Golovinomyces magnicellulatus]|nr:hypothetical protein Golomagni_02715 [Golovinomyces magnicellulatus]
MNRFRRKKDVRDTTEGASRTSIESETLTTSFTKRSFRLGKKNIEPEPEPKSDINLASVLPSNDNFRTSLLMQGLSARFSMLREQDDPSSKMGKASDDSVMFSKRISKYNDFSFLDSGLSDIAEASVHKTNNNFFEIERAVSNASLPCDRSNDEPKSCARMLNRSRPGEGNNLFGGRQKINVGNRILYEDDVRLSSYQRERRSERERLRQKSETTASLPLEALYNENDNNISLPPQKLSSKITGNRHHSPILTSPQNEIRSKKFTSATNESFQNESHALENHGMYKAGVNNYLHEKSILEMAKHDMPTHHSTQPSPNRNSSEQNNRKKEDVIVSNFVSTQISKFGGTSLSNIKKYGLVSPPLSPPVSNKIKSLALNRSSSDSVASLSINSPDTLTSNLDEYSQDLFSSWFSSPSDKFLSETSINSSQNPSESTHHLINSEARSLSEETTKNDCNIGPTSIQKLELSSSSKNLSKTSFNESSLLSCDSRSNSFTSSSVKDAILNSSNLLNQLETQYQTPTELNDISDSKNPEIVNLNDEIDSINPDLPSAPESLDRSEKTDRPDSPAMEIPNEIIGMVRQHMRFQSNTSSVYGAPPSIDQFDLDYDIKSAGSHNDYLIQTNPWEEENDEGDSALLVQDNELKTPEAGLDSSSSPGKYHVGSFINEETVQNTLLEKEVVQPNAYISNTPPQAAKNHDPHLEGDKKIYTKTKRKETGFFHDRLASIDTQREREDLQNELASRRRHVQEKMKSFVESDSLLSIHAQIPEVSKDGLPRNSAFAILRTKNSRGSVKPKDNNTKSMKKFGLVNLSSSNVTTPKNISGEEDNDGEIGSTGNLMISTSQDASPYRHARNEFEYERESQISSNLGKLDNIKIVSSCKSILVLPLQTNIQEEKINEALLKNFYYDPCNNGKYKNSVDVKSHEGHSVSSTNNRTPSRIRCLLDDPEENLLSTNKYYSENSPLRESSETSSSKTFSTISQSYSDSSTNSVYCENDLIQQHAKPRSIPNIKQHLIHYMSSSTSNQSNVPQSLESLVLNSAYTSPQTSILNVPVENSSVCEITNKRLPPIPSSVTRWHTKISRLQAPYKRKSDEKTTIF